MPTMTLNPYLAFSGNAREAIEFYHSILGGELTVVTFAEGGMPHQPDQADKVMHSYLDAPHGMVLMASDLPPGVPEPAPNGRVAVSLSGDDEDTLRRYWDGLSEGGTVQQPLEKAPWGDLFGMCNDRFGVSWLVDVTAGPS